MGQFESDRALLDLAVTLALATGVDDLLARAGKGIRAAFAGAKRVSVCLPAPDAEDMLDVIVVDGVSGIEQGDRFPIIDGLSGIAMAAQHSLVTDLHREPVGEANWLVPLGVDTLVNTPMVMNGHSLGVLNLGFAGCDIDLPAIELAATLVAGQLDRLAALTRARDEAHLRAEHTGRLLRLHQIERELSDVANLDELLEVLSHRISELVPATRVTFGERIFGAGQVNVIGVLGMDEIPSGTLLPADECEMDGRYDEEPFIYTPDHTASIRANERTVLERAGIQSSGSFGVFVDGTVVGVLNVGSDERDAYDDEDLALLGALASFMGSTLERIQAQAELTYSANHDHVTGLSRRSVFEQSLAHAVTSDSGAVVFIDIDDFKLVNDQYGHAAGDGVLREVADRLVGEIGECGLAARLGGDEVAVLLAGQDAGVYELLVERLVASVAEKPFHMLGRDIELTISAGLCTFVARQMSAAEALSFADAACYSAKRLGGNAVALASADDVDQESFRLAATRLSAVRHALTHDELVLFSQPIVDLHTGGVRGAEVLLRMEQDGTIQSGAAILPIVERYGLGESVDLWVLQRGLELWPHLVRQHGRPMMLFVNLSVNSVCSAGFADRVLALIEDANVPATCLCFEITETGTMRNFEVAQSFVRTMREAGVAIALDDFGVGLSSLGHLRRLPVDYLKLDGSLVVGIEHDEVLAAMVRSVNLMADALGLRVIAEHVETEAAVTRLIELGVASGQGYHLGRPGPIRGSV
ncbi:MAG: EAL domain-containing protein [Actinomycetota bacterium]